ncbi:hypothetical protein ACROYT_G031422 [Oculina patagonica]
MASFATILLLIAVSGRCLAEHISIDRGVAFPSDDLLLPPSLCPSFSPMCSKFGAHPLGGCWCSCPRSYTFYEHAFKCAHSTAARQSAGCDLGFTDEAEDKSLPFFQSVANLGKIINVPDNQNCSFYFGNELHVNYLRCDGSWKSQSLTGVVDVTPGWSTSQLTIKLKPGSSLPQSMAGRTVRIAIQCGALNSELPFRTTCVMFKIKGEISCTYPQPTPAPSQPIATLPTPVTRPKKPTTTARPTTVPVTQSPGGKQNTSLHLFEDAPIKCVLGSTVVFKNSPNDKCGFLSPIMFNCCRVCNMEHSTCIQTVENDYNGSIPHCYRGSYKCMCKCLEENNVPENYYQ